MNTELKVLYLHAHCMQNKVGELTMWLEIGRSDFVDITELWLNENQSWELNIQRYTSYRKERLVSRWGGLARNEIQSIARNHLESDHVDSLWGELRKCKGKRTLFGVIYGPLNGSQDVGYKLHQETEKACK